MANKMDDMFCSIVAKSGRDVREAIERVYADDALMEKYRPAYERLAASQPKIGEPVQVKLGSKR